MSALSLYHSPEADLNNRMIATTYKNKLIERGKKNICMNTYILKKFFINLIKIVQFTINCCNNIVVINLWLL